MTPTERLIELLEALGWKVDLVIPARGYWTHAHQDVQCWCAFVEIPGMPGTQTVGSWDTITACARRGFTVHGLKADTSGHRPTASGRIEVFANPKGQGLKTFTAMEPVEFIRDTEHNRPWEPGEYVRMLHDMKGWHRVRDATGTVHTVPARRIRKKTK